ncbi:ArdC family protein [Novosphingobium huizhouense]|uniref:ArdC family protein n=1 Tax=Novosphingobium huizhouense TaxID=2866625 RepID=UPI001CD876A0|nr:zincin-like metallopeptidase domain-containing protein [Novosphingobium huizhouense]
MSKPDIYETITSAIVRRLEAGTKPWAPSWATDGTTGGTPPLPLRVTGECYRGINVLLLWASADENGFRSRRWMTFKQAQALGGSVRKGSKGTGIVFFKKLTVTEQNDAGEDQERNIPMMRGFTVFNADQIEGLPAKFYARPAVIPGASKERDEVADSALRSSGAQIRESGDRAYYAPTMDLVNMPTFDRFATVGGYLATLAHELCHWSGHESRLNRQLLNKFGSKDYAFEELVAEIGAAFVGARLGIVGDHIDDHAAYLAHWLQALRSDKRMIFKAASLAQQACDLVLANAGELDGFAEFEDRAEPVADAPVPGESPLPVALGSAAPAQFALAL